MTVQNPIVKNVYEGNGSTTVFPFTFALSANDGASVGVYVTNADTGQSEKLTSGYTVNATAKTVKYPTSGSPLAAGRKITIIRELADTQDLNLENLGPFYAESIEGQLDRIVMMIQQVDEKISRATLADISE